MTIFSRSCFFLLVLLFSFFLLYRGGVFYRDAHSSSQSGGGRLDFTERELDVHAGLQEDKIRVSFTFKNSGDQPIEITKIDSNCSCLYAKADKKIYQPGEIGKIEAAFALRFFTGFVSKMLRVHTNAAVNKQTRLIVNVHIPRLVEIQPKRLEWGVGDKNEEKTFRFQVKQETPIHITAIKCSDARIQVAWKTLVEGKEYAIKVSPESTEKPLYALLKIETDCKIRHRSKFLASISITTKGAK